MMKSVLVFPLITIGLLLAGCSKKDETGAGPTVENVAVSSEEMTGATPAPVMTGIAFADTAAASDAFEIATSKLALERSSNPAIKAFAQDMIKAHTDSTTKLKSAAALASPPIKPDPTLPADLSVKLGVLKSEPKATFDARYASMQVEAHEATLTALKTYASTGDVAALQGFADELMGPVSRHLEMARGLK